MSDARPLRAAVAPSPSAPSAELVEEARQGGTETARAVNAALLSLSRTARSFTLYDANNKAVREFLSDLRAKIAKALEAAGGPLDLEVRAFELALGGEVVYLERDRERSLAFRLYRDGVRRLGLLPGLVWDEILGLVEILSVRYTGVRQQEDDIVTLLSKAAFPHVAFVAIEGFSPDEEVEDEGGAAVPDHVVPPADWDLPAAPLDAAAGFAVRPLSAAALAALRGDEDEDSAARECVDLVLDLVDCVADDRDPMNEDDLEGLAFEVRDFLLAEGRWAELLEVVAALERSAAGDLRARPSILSRFAGADALRRLAQGLVRGGGALPSEAVSCLRAIPGNHVADALELLTGERDEPTRAALLSLVAALAADQPRGLAERLAKADAETAGVLLDVLERTAPAQAGVAALALASRPDPRLQLAALRALVRLKQPAEVNGAVAPLLESPDTEVRTAAIECLAACRGDGGFDALVAYAQGRAGHGLTNDEAALVGDALARVDPSAALALFVDWLHPHGLLQRVMESPARRLLHRAAVAGLARVPGEDAERELRAFLEKSSGELHQLCLTALVERRRAQRARDATAHAR
jgi:hypothetical protein